MTNSTANLLLSLHRWAARQDENFTTEAFVFVLNHLLSHEPSSARRILGKLSEGLLDITEAELPRVRVGAQARVEEGRPDIEISAPGHMVFIEVKVTAGLGLTQLERYRNALMRSGCQRTGLVLLSRYPEIPAGCSGPDISIRWHQVNTWLEEELMQGLADPASVFLIKQFTKFLQGRNLALARVEAPVALGIRDYVAERGYLPITKKRICSLAEIARHESLLPLHNLLMMMGEALAGLSSRPRVVFDSGKHNGGWIGYNLEHMRYWFYLYFNDPDTIQFTTGNSEVVLERFDGQVGEIVKQRPLMWRNRMALSAAGTDFYERSKVEQYGLIQDFLDQSYRIARSMART